MGGDAQYTLVGSRPLCSMAAQITVTAGVTHSTLNTSTASSRTTIAGRPLSHLHHAVPLKVLPQRPSSTVIWGGATTCHALRPSHAPPSLFLHCPDSLLHNRWITRVFGDEDDLSGLALDLLPDYDIHVGRMHEISVSLFSSF